jgi:hypothetical protein
MEENAKDTNTNGAQSLNVQNFFEKLAFFDFYRKLSLFPSNYPKYLYLFFPVYDSYSKQNKSQLAEHDMVEMFAQKLV